MPDEEAGTVTFHLVRPAPSFLKILATSVFAIVPAGTPIDLEGEPIPATGPYLIDDAGQDGSVVLERNPTFREWSADAQPDGFADRIEVVTGIDPSEQVAMVERGEADFAFGGVPFDLVEELDRRASDQLVRSPWPSIMALGLNTAKHHSRTQTRDGPSRSRSNEVSWSAPLTRPRRSTGGEITAEEPAVNMPDPPAEHAGVCPLLSLHGIGRGGGRGMGGAGSLTRTPAGPALGDSGCGGNDRHVTVLAVDCCVGQGHAPKAWDIAWSWKPTARLPTRIAPSSPFRRTRTSPSTAGSGTTPLLRSSWCPSSRASARRVAPLRGRARRDGYRGLFTGTSPISATRRSTGGCGERWISSRPTRMRRLARSRRSTTTSSIWQPLIPYAAAVDLWFVSKRVSNVEFSPQFRLIVSQVWVR